MTEPTMDERIEELRDSCFACNRSKRYHNLVPHPFIVNPALAIIDELKDMADLHETHVTHLKAENARLKKFAEKAFEVADSCDIQDKGSALLQCVAELGLLEARKVNPNENEWDASELYFPIWSKR